MITIVRLTLLEAVRRRLLWALVVLTLVVVAITGWGFEGLVSLARADRVDSARILVGVSQLLILVAFMFSFVLAMTAAFMAAPAVAGEIETGVALAILARPIRRADYLVGKWTGLAIVITLYAVGAGLLEVAVVWQLTGYGPPDPLRAVGYLAFEAIVLLSLSLALGTRLSPVPSGAIAVVVFGLAWVAGVLGGIGAFFDAPALVQAAEVSRILVPLDGLWRGVIFSLEPPALVALGLARGPAFTANPFFAAEPPSPAYLAWAVTWVVVVVALGVLSLRRREL